ncbi:MAG: molybdopterin biosynthesis protein [Candidatus Acetothermia bacterium]
MRKEFRDLISPEEFQRLIDGMDLERHVKTVEITRARGMSSANNIFSQTDVPPYNRSLMDGYAVIASDTYGADEENPIRLDVVGSVEIGSPSSVEVRSKETVEIATGTEMPRGANAVVMVEDTDKNGDRLEIRRSVVPTENVLHSGSDIASGDLIIRRNQKLTPMELAKLAACGRDTVEVYDKPRVGVVSTGPELVPPGEELGPSQIFDINASLLTTGIEEAGGSPEFLGTVNDDRDQLMNIFSRGNEDCDLLVTSGSTSAGPHDVVYSILEETGEVLAHGVKIKPGKPTVLGLFNGTPVFGLPGNPSSAYVIFMNFVAPFIGKAAGLTEGGSSGLTARITERTRSEGGRLEQKFVGLVRREGESRAYPINKASGAITLLSQADGYVEIPEGVNFLERGEEVNVNLLSRDPALPKLLIIGSNCKGVHRLLDLLDFDVRYLSRGSTGGVRAIEGNVADLAGVHIWSPQGYNVPFLEDRGLQGVSLLRGYLREQGLILPAGNPKSIESVVDLIEKDVKIVNRTGGSGTRILFDHLLGEAAEDLGVGFSAAAREIDGYEVELSTHSSVATAISGGKAGAGMGIRTVAEEMGLDFVKLQDEQFDILARRDVLDDPHGNAFQEALRSPEFKRELDSLPGLSSREEMGEIVFSA